MRISNPWYRWHPEVALRYLPLVSFIRASKGAKKILDVGSGGLGIAPYLRRRVTGLDKSFSPPIHPLLDKVKGSALSLPFENESYDIVVSADTLEHMSKKDRAIAISEMIRVAKQAVLIAVPCGKKALQQDQYLDALYEKSYHKRFYFLEEQIGYGLPEEEDIKKDIFRACHTWKKRIKIVIKGNEQLSLRKFLMRGWMKKDIFSNVFFRKILLIFLPIFQRMNHPPTYRKIFYVTILSSL